jgi:hypothetical protein
MTSETQLTTSNQNGVTNSPSLHRMVNSNSHSLNKMAVSNHAAFIKWRLLGFYKTATTPVFFKWKSELSGLHEMMAGIAVSIK